MAAALVFMVGVSLGDLIITKDAKRYEGEVVEETDDWITVRTDRGTSRIHRDFIATWERKKQEPGSRLRYFVLRGGEVKVGELMREGRLSVVLRVQGRDERVSRSRVVESAPCERTPAPSGPATGLPNPRSRDEGTVSAVYALAFAGRGTRGAVELDALVTVYLDPLEPHAARLAALDLMASLGAKALDALEAATTDRNRELRMQAVLSLRALAGPQARRRFEALIVRWLAKGELPERSWAVEAAVAENATRAAGELRKLVDSSERALRLKAAWAIARLGGRAEAGLLMRAAHEAADEVLRKGFLKALREAVGEADARKFAATLPELGPKAAEVVGTTDVEKKVDVHLDRADAGEAIMRLAEENALAIEVLPAAEKYLNSSKPVTLHLDGTRLILAFRWMARQGGASISVKPGKVRVLPGRMTADMSSEDERKRIARKLGERIALPGGSLGRCFRDIARLAGVNVVLSTNISEKELSMAGLRSSEAAARKLLGRLCATMRLNWSILDEAVYVRR